MTATPPERRTVPGLAAMAARGEKIAMLTCYDASFAVLEERAGVDVMLVGDSLGMVIGGHPSTLAVALDDIAYHTRAVARAAQRAVIVADLPFGTYGESPAQAYRSAAVLMAAGAHMVKLEGGAWLVPTVEFLVARGVPVCAHLGLTPQSVHQFGGYRVQARDAGAAATLTADAVALGRAGAGLLVLEMVPAPLATTVTRECAAPTIGIGAGAGCAGQVLVVYDMLGLYPGKLPRFVRNFMQGAASIEDALAAYVRAVKDGSFPTADHSY
ncbi:MAG: 3-methyl-2-oxobutanoate hydroxymethyltransferase [Proteobacteria bacterium]|nr:3-methyl-2-oxobutanoate hydroxymethyltransferase [Pseudomonadota bacterium]